MDLAVVMKRLLENGIHRFVSRAGDSNWEAKLGEETSGFVAEENFETLGMRQLPGP